ncbi:MAG: hypothetical protein DHS20C20_26180 [Ardenticatenaceae bacterium]|nr:MAG: hypothetical protein DHS20C20_26180 [Ardenticatenaceae bacterium]
MAVGSEVEAGDVLARIDDTDAQQALLNAQLQYQQTAMQTDASVTETGVSYDEISVAQAQISPTAPARSLPSATPRPDAAGRPAAPPTLHL